MSSQDQMSVDELENDIILMQQEIILKRRLLNECKEKLETEISYHKEARLTLNELKNHNEELKIQLDISLKATQSLESENNKNRELLAKLQAQTTSYLAERQELLDRCFNAEVESRKLKSELTDLKSEFNVHITAQENYKQKQSQTEALVNEILSKQEILQREQRELEITCKEGLLFAAKVAEEAEFQAKFVKEANITRLKMEEEMVHLLAMLKSLQDLKENSLTENQNAENFSYFEEWKEYQRENNEKLQQLTEDNRRLSEELNLATANIGVLVNDLLEKNQFQK